MKGDAVSIELFGEQVEVFEQDLPPEGVIGEVLGIIDLKACVDFLKAFNDTRVFISASGQGAERIKTVVGEENWRKIYARFQGEQIQPLGLKTLQRAARNRLIVRDRWDGLGILEIAKKYDLTYRHIRNIIRSCNQKGKGASQ